MTPLGTKTTSRHVQGRTDINSDPGRYETETLHLFYEGIEVRTSKKTLRNFFHGSRFQNMLVRYVATDDNTFGSSERIYPPTAFIAFGELLLLWRHMSYGLLYVFTYDR